MNDGREITTFEQNSCIFQTIIAVFTYDHLIVGTATFSTLKMAANLTQFST